jgi:ABC-type transporter Mla maintaining outer membrane lipid asymmetry ATPase subunit MlaF
METPLDAPPALIPLLELRDATIPALDAPARPMIEAVDWSVTAGEYWVIGGRPGSGKSDLLAVAAGLVRPLCGRHRLFGRELTGRQGDELLPERLRVGLVFDDGGRLFSAMTVRDNVALPLCYHRHCAPEAVRDRVNAVLEATGLTALGNRPGGRINRSWRQRAALARALALEPEALLLDNPLTGLDPRQVRWWLEFVDALVAGHPVLGGRPATLVVATDELRPWRQRGDHFALIDGGRWRLVGGRADLERS